jgi:hypothetical protein
MYGDDGLVDEESSFCRSWRQERNNERLGQGSWGGHFSHEFMVRGRLKNKEKSNHNFLNLYFNVVLYFY